MPENTEAHDIITTAQDAITPTEIAPGLHIVTTRDGDTRVLDNRHLLQDHLALEHPRRKTGDKNVTSVGALVEYLTKHGLPETELWGSRDRGTIQAIINSHSGILSDGEPMLGHDVDGQPGLAGWGDHTITLTLRHSDDWKDWTATDGKMLPQVEFAEFIEDHQPNLGRPTAAEMLELAQTFRATTNVEFNSSKRLATGETTLTYAETTDAKAGKKGDLAIPDSIAIAMPVYDQGKPYPVTARLRYRIHGGNLLLGYKLDRPRDVLQAAFDDVITDVETNTDRTVWATS